MTVERWLENARADAERRRLPELVPILETLARATTALRSAAWLRDADGVTPGAAQVDARPEGE